MVFGSFYALNRVMVYLAHRGTEGALLEMWRGSQCWVRAAAATVRVSISNPTACAPASIHVATLILALSCPRCLPPPRSG